MKKDHKVEMGGFLLVSLGVLVGLFFILVCLFVFLCFASRRLLHHFCTFSLS